MSNYLPASPARTWTYPGLLEQAPAGIPSNILLVWCSPQPGALPSLVPAPAWCHHRLCCPFWLQFHDNVADTCCSSNCVKWRIFEIFLFPMCFISLWQISTYCSNREGKRWGRALQPWLSPRLCLSGVCRKPAVSRWSLSQCVEAPYRDMETQRVIQILLSLLCTGQLRDVTIDSRWASYNVDPRKQTYNAARLLRPQLKAPGLTATWEMCSPGDKTR